MAGRHSSGGSRDRENLGRRRSLRFAAVTLAAAMAHLGCASTCRVARMPDGTTVTSCRGRDERASVHYQAARDLRCPRSALRWARGGITSDWRAIHGVEGCGHLAYYVCERHEQRAPMDDLDRTWEIRYECRRVDRER